MKFLDKFFLTYVASASIAVFKLVSFVLSVTLTVGEDDEASTVQFLWTDSSGELTETLKLYCITNNTLSFYCI